MVRLIIDHSGYHLRNLGDVAMLQGALQRIRSIVPQAELRVITSDSDRLERFAPDASPVPHQLPQVLERRRLFPVPHRLIPSPLRGWVLQWEQEKRVLRMKQNLGRMSRVDPSAAEWIHLLRSCDAIIATGGGYLTDSFADHAFRVLTHLSLAQALEKPTAFFGQGIGPIKNERLVRATKHVLSRSQVVGLREPTMGPAWLKAEGIDGHVTGDDALEIMDFEANGKGIDRSAPIGLNIRATEYAGMDARALERIQVELEEMAKADKQTFLPVPIDFVKDASDERSALSCIPQGCLDAAYIRPKTPRDVMALAARCRFVITGSYHAALFALAQGVPVVGIEATSYYRGKFDGLEALYPGGVQRYHSGDKAGIPLNILCKQAEAVGEQQREGWRCESIRLCESGRYLIENFLSGL